LETLDVYIAQRLEGLDETEVDRLAREGKLPKVRRAVELIDRFESLGISRSRCQYYFKKVFASIRYFEKVYSYF